MGRMVDGIEARWHAESEAIISGMKEWRAAHPRATLTEIEVALDARLHGMRARMLEDLALASLSTELGAAPPEERPVGAACGVRLQARGKRARVVTTQGDRLIRLDRDYAACPQCGGGLFPPG